VRLRELAQGEENRILIHTLEAQEYAFFRLGYTDYSVGMTQKGAWALSQGGRVLGSSSSTTP
jgi:hypothetical protein